MKKVLLIVLVLCLAVPAWAAPEGKIRLGVLQFESKTHSVSQAQAEAILEMMTRALVNSKTIAVIERAKLAAVGQEIRLGQSGLVDINTAAELGRVNGVQYILLGSVTGLTNKTTAGAIPLFVIPGAVATGANEAQATIDARIIDTSTAEVKLALSETGYSTSDVSGFSIYGATMAEANFGDEEGRAISDAVTRLAAKIRSELGGETSHVLEVKGNEAIIDVGSTMGAKEGALYLAYADGKTIFDMDNNPISKERLPLAVLKIREVASGHSVCTIVKGSKKELLRRGDSIEPINSKMAKAVRYASSRPAASSGTFEQLFGNKGEPEKTAVQISSVQEPTPNSEVKKAEPKAEPKNPSSALAPNPAVREAQDFDPNNSTDAKVIDTYPLTPGDKNVLGITQRNAYKAYSNKHYKQAYEGFVRAAEAHPEINYLSAYWAGVTAEKLKRRSEAVSWIDKALAINPDYQPAQSFKTEIEKTPAKKKKK